MDDETLLNIALAVSIMGIASLLLMSYAEKIPLYDIDEITKSDIGERIELEGRISSILMHNDSMTLTISSKCTINAYVADKKNHTKGSNVKITGIVEEYDGKINIRAEKIEIANNQ